MANGILPKPLFYTIRLTDEQYAAHWELMRFGSLMAQHFHRAWFVHFDASQQQSAQVSFEATLLQMLSYLAQGKRYAHRWDALGLDRALIDAYQQADVSEIG